MRLVVDLDLCIGCGVCEQECPELFEVGDDGLAHAIVDDPGPELFDCAGAAEEICPVDAISILGE